MYLVDLADIVARVDTLEDARRRSRGIWSKIYEDMDSTEVLWVFAPNLHFDQGHWCTSMEFGDIIQRETEFFLRNTITLHRHYDGEGGLRPSYEEILFFAKNKNDYYFDKDSIRVDNVYEGEEWFGHREEGQSSYRDKETKRYNPNGKDPGNVWLEEFRNETSSQAVDRTGPLGRPRFNAARRCTRAGSKEEESVKVVWASDEVVSAIQEAGRSVDCMLKPGEEVRDNS